MKDKEEVIRLLQKKEAGESFLSYKEIADLGKVLSSVKIVSGDGSIYNPFELSL